MMSKKQMQRRIAELETKLDTMERTAGSLFNSGTTFLMWYRESLEVTLELLEAGDTQTLERVARETLADLDEAKRRGDVMAIEHTLGWRQ